MPDQQLTIGRAGTPDGRRYLSAALLGRARPDASPRPRLGTAALPPSAVQLVGIILLLRDVGFSLRELKGFIASRPPVDGWRQLAQRKLAELDQRIAQAQAARTAIAHALACPQEDILHCPNFASVVTTRLAGTPLQEAHPH